MKCICIFPILFVALACETDSPVDFDDGQNDCFSGAYLRFEPTLSGQGAEYSVSVDTDFGVAVAEFDVPFTCDFVTGTTEDRTTNCTSVPYEQYGDIQVNEVSPPVLYFDQENVGGPYSLRSVFWGYESQGADVVVRRAGSVVFEGAVSFQEKTCNNGVKDLNYREAVVKISQVGGAGGQGGDSG